jgi:hypothetical protein
MTAKEKAKDLVEKFTDFGKEYTQFPVEAAITCIDEMIKEYNLLQRNEFHDARVCDRVTFLNTVKQELEKML